MLSSKTWQNCCWSKSLIWLIVLFCLNAFLSTRLSSTISNHSNYVNTSNTNSHAGEDYKIYNAAATNKNNIKEPNASSSRKLFQNLESGQLFEHVDFTKGRWDNSRIFKILEHAYTGSEYVKLSKEYDVTLVTQSSLDKLSWLIKVSSTWTGPISLSLFVPDIEFNFATKFLEHLFYCDTTYLASKLAVHLIFPGQKFPKKNVSDSILDHQFQCSANVAKVLSELFKAPALKNKEFQKWRTSYPYPQNLARNVARKGANTNYTFVTDIDVIPSRNSAKQLSNFLKSNTCSKCAFVVATYELQSKVIFPNNKSQLVLLVKRNQARPFHHTVFKMNQYATNFSVYEKVIDDNSSVHVSHPVTNYEFFYEPFYISLDNVPPYDERFVGYGFTRNTQVFEMHTAGWTFHVLSPIFAIHWGFQVKKGRPNWRERQNSKNRIRFKSFKNEVLVRYGKGEIKIENSSDNEENKDNEQSKTEEKKENPKEKLPKNTKRKKQYQRNGIKWIPIRE